MKRVDSHSRLIIICSLLILVVIMIPILYNVYKQYQSKKVLSITDIFPYTLDSNTIIEISITSSNAPIMTTFRDSDLIQQSVDALSDISLKQKYNKARDGIPMKVSIVTSSETFTFYPGGSTIQFNNKSYQCNKNISEVFKEIYKESCERNGSVNLVR